MPVIFDPATVRPGDIYQHHFGNDQSYGYSIPVKTSRGWDLIDTYQLSSPSWQNGEGSDKASVRRIIELASTEHDFYAPRCASNFYHQNITRNVTCPLESYVLVCNLNDFNISSDREAADYDPDDVLKHIPLYFEQHYSWNLGHTLGLTFVKKDAQPKSEQKLKAFINDINDTCDMMPSARNAQYILEHDVRPLIQSMTESGQLSDRDRLRYELTCKRVEAIDACNKAISQARSEYYSQLVELESADHDDSSSYYPPLMSAFDNSASDCDRYEELYEQRRTSDKHQKRPSLNPEPTDAH